MQFFVSFYWGQPQMRSQQAYSAQAEILLTSLATCCARVGSAIDDFVRGQNSKTKNIIFFEVSQNGPGSAGAPRRVTRGDPRDQFRFKNTIFQDFETSTFWPSGPSPGASGPSRQPLDLPSRAAWGVPGWFGGLFKVGQSPLLRSWVYGGHKWTARGLEQ